MNPFIGQCQLTEIIPERASTTHRLLHRMRPRSRCRLTCLSERKAPLNRRHLCGAVVRQVHVYRIFLLALFRPAEAIFDEYCKSSYSVGTSVFDLLEIHSVPKPRIDSPITVPPLELPHVFRFDRIPDRLQSLRLPSLRLEHTSACLPRLR